MKNKDIYNMEMIEDMEVTEEIEEIEVAEVVEVKSTNKNHTNQEITMNNHNIINKNLPDKEALRRQLLHHPNMLQNKNHQHSLQKK